MSWIQTYTGKKFDLLDPKPESICIVDIAHALAALPRYTGHTWVPVSVAQHSCCVAEMLPDNLKLEGLLHDASEAYLGDVSAPLKSLLPDYRKIEKVVQDAICNRFGARLNDSTECKPVRDADLVALATERRDLMSDPPEPWFIDSIGIKPLDRVIIPAQSLAVEHLFIALLDRYKRI